VPNPVRWEDRVPIDPGELAEHLARLGGLDPVDAGLDEALARVVDETDNLFAVNGAGLMLADEGGTLRYIAASDEPGRMLEAVQEQTGEGPCVDAFLHDAPVLATDLAADPRWPSAGPMAAGHGVRAVLGVPIDLGDRPVGTLNVYAAKPHQWDDSDIAAIMAYTRVIASMLRSAVQAHVKGKAATQLQHALHHRVLVEQAKGIMMERRKLDQQAAFELLRAQARSSRQRLEDVARQVIGGGRLPG
jgi:transcriptional regulator with GAF, ATPase, and Fis domain